MNTVPFLITLLLVQNSLEAGLRTDFEKVKPLPSELQGFQPFVARSLVRGVPSPPPEESVVGKGMRPGTRSASTRWEYSRFATNGGTETLEVELFVESDVDNLQRRLRLIHRYDQGPVPHGSLTGRRIGDFVESFETGRNMFTRATSGNCYVDVNLILQPDKSPEGARILREGKELTDRVAANVLKRAVETHWPSLNGTTPPP